MSYNTGSYQSPSNDGALLDDIKGMIMSANQCQKIVEGFGGPRDTETERANVVARISALQEGLRTLESRKNTMKSSITQGRSATEISPTDKKLLRRLDDDSKRAVAMITKLVNDYEIQRKRNPMAKSVGFVGDVAPIAPKQGRMKQVRPEHEPLLQNMQQINFEASIVRERDQAIDSMASTMVTVNETMKEIASLVEQQGVGIDQIENNTTEAETHAAKGVEELHQAEKYHKSYRKWIFVLLLIVLMIAGGITAYFVIQNKKK